MSFYKNLAICFLGLLFSYCDSKISIPEKDINEIEKHLECASKNRRNSLVAADSCVDLAIKLAEEKNYNKGLVKAYKLKGNIIAGKGDYSSSLAWLEKSLAIATTSDDTLGFLSAKMNIGTIKTQLGKREEAIKLMEELLADLDKFKVEKAKVNVLLNLAIMYANVGNYQKAQDGFLAAKKLLDNSENPKKNINMYIVLYNGLGNLFDDIKDYEKAVKYYSEGLKLLPESHYRTFQLYNNIGSTLTEMGRLEEAKPYFEKVIKSDIARKSSKIHAFANLAELHDEMGQYDEVLKYCDLGLKFAKKNNFKELELNLLAQKGEAYLRKGNNQKASEILSVVESGYSDTKNLKQLLSVKELLIKANIGTCKSGIDINKTFTEYAELKDTLFDDKMLDRIEDLEIKHDAENNRKNAEISAANAERNLYGGILASLIALLLLFSFYRERKAHKREEKLKETVAKLRAGDNHRTDNAFKRVLSELDRQAESTEIPSTKVAINKARSLVNTSQVIHNILREHDDDKEVNVPIASALNTLCKELKLIFTDKKSMEIDINCDDSLKINQRTIQPLFLIVEELFTNAWKHAFEYQGNPKIELSLNSINEKFIRLSYQDNGKGLPKNIDFNKEDSEGLELIRHFTNSLGGKMDIDSSNGLMFNIDFDKNKMTI